MGLDERRTAARQLMEARGLDALILQQFPNFAWYTDGGDNRVDHASAVGVASVVITREREVVLTDNIEANRMRAEQTPGFDVGEYRWFDGPSDSIRALAGRGTVGCDGDIPLDGALRLDAEIARLRWVLDDEAIVRYESVGRETAEALEEAASALIPGMVELEAAAEVVAACRRRGLFSPVVLAAGDARISRFRHPLPSAAEFHQRVMLVVCAERGGLYANLTVFVHFEEPDADWIRRRDATERILRQLREESTRAGRTLGDVFADIETFYRDEGFGDEWQLHHQGGTTGYATREVIARPGSDVTIQEGMAFAWNPSVTGAKAEETFLLTEGGPRVIARAHG
jgi:antitoxin VapB